METSFSLNWELHTSEKAPDRDQPACTSGHNYCTSSIISVY